jgi:hypothetical protein
MEIDEATDPQNPFQSNQPYLDEYNQDHTAEVSSGDSEQESSGLFSEQAPVQNSDENLEILENNFPGALKRFKEDKAILNTILKHVDTLVSVNNGERVGPSGHNSIYTDENSDVYRLVNGTDNAADEPFKRDGLVLSFFRILLLSPEEKKTYSLLSNIVKRTLYMNLKWFYIFDLKGRENVAVVRAKISQFIEIPVCQLYRSTVLSSLNSNIFGKSDRIARMKNAWSANIQELLAQTKSMVINAQAYGYNVSKTFQTASLGLLEWGLEYHLELKPFTRLLQALLFELVSNRVKKLYGKGSRNANNTILCWPKYAHGQKVGTYDDKQIISENELSKSSKIMAARPGKLGTEHLKDPHFESLIESDLRNPQNPKKVSKYPKKYFTYHWAPLYEDENANSLLSYVQKFSNRESLYYFTKDFQETFVNPKTLELVAHQLACMDVLTFTGVSEDRNFSAYQNGVVCLLTGAQLYTWEELQKPNYGQLGKDLADIGEPVPNLEEINSCHIFHENIYWPEELNEYRYSQVFDMVNDKPAVDTGHFDQILKTQNFLEKNKYQWFFALLGRNFFWLKEWDNWDVFTGIVGLSRTGKSAIISTILHYYYPRRVAMFSVSLQDKFSLEHIIDAWLIAAYELSEDFAKAVSPNDLFSLACGEKLAINRKFQMAISVIILATLLFGGNTLLNMFAGKKDVNSMKVDALGNRMVIIPFEVITPHQDTGLFHKITTENHCTLLKKMVNAYLWKAIEHENQSLWNRGPGCPNLPEVFYAHKGMLKSEQNPLARFINDNFGDMYVVVPKPLRFECASDEEYFKKYNNWKFTNTVAQADFIESVKDYYNSRKNKNVAREVSALGKSHLWKFLSDFTYNNLEIDTKNKVELKSNGVFKCDYFIYGLRLKQDEDVLKREASMIFKNNFSRHLPSETEKPGLSIEEIRKILLKDLKSAQKTLSDADFDKTITPMFVWTDLIQKNTIEPNWSNPEAIKSLTTKLQDNLITSDEFFTSLNDILKDPLTTFRLSESVGGLYTVNVTPDASAEKSKFLDQFNFSKTKKDPTDDEAEFLKKPPKRKNDSSVPNPKFTKPNPPQTPFDQIKKRLQSKEEKGHPKKPKPGVLHIQ